MRIFKTPLARELLVLLAAATMLVPAVTLAQSPKPFKATIAISEVLQPLDGQPCIYLGHISGTGNATHMGKVTMNSTDCIAFANPLKPDPTSLAFSSNQLVITAANGDQIFATYIGTFTIEGAVGAINGGYQIAGGTGRFSQATGQGLVQGLENIGVMPARGEVQLTGTITY